MTGEPSSRSRSGGEHRLPPAAAVVVAAVIYALLPQSLLLAPRLIIPAVELALLVAVLATNTRRLTTPTRWSRTASLALAAVVVLTISW